MRLIFLVLAMVTCASGLSAQTQFQVRPIAIQRSVAPGISRVNPVVIPRTVTVANPVVRNVSPVKPLQIQPPTTIHLQRLSPAQSRALDNAVRSNNYNLYYDNYGRYLTQKQAVENQADHIARLQGIIQSGTQPTSVQPGAGLGYSSETVRQVQTALRQLGYYHGQVDGQFGSGTQDALQNYQLKANQPATGLLDRQTLSQLGVVTK
jgi:hypothetical protein